MEDADVPQIEAGTPRPPPCARKELVKSIAVGLLVFATAVQLCTAFIAALDSDQWHAPYLTAAVVLRAGDYVGVFARYVWVLRVATVGIVLLAVSVLCWLLLRPSLGHKAMLGIIAVALVLGFLNTGTGVCGPPRGHATVFRHSSGGYINVYKVQYGLACWPRWMRVYNWSKEPVASNILWTGQIRFSREEFLREQSIARDAVSRWTRWAGEDPCGEDFDGLSSTREHGEDSTPEVNPMGQ